MQLETQRVTGKKKERALLEDALLINCGLVYLHRRLKMISSGPVPDSLPAFMRDNCPLQLGGAEHPKWHAELRLWHRRFSS